MAEQLSLFKDNTARDAALRRIRQQLDSDEQVHLVSAKTVIRNGIRTTSTTWSNGYTDTVSERMP